MKKLIIATLGLVVATANVGCSEKPSRNNYVVISSVLSALTYGNRNYETFNDVDLTDLAENGYMAPGDFPFAQEKLTSGEWKIEILSDKEIEFRASGVDNYCSDPDMINSFAIKRVKECVYQEGTIILTLSKD